MAATLLPRLAHYATIVVPSGSCAAMMIRNYPHLFPADSPWAEQARSVAGRTVELTAYLAPVAAAVPWAPEPAGPCALHRSCHTLRGSGAPEAPLRCLQAAGCPLVPFADDQECCGFGGLFAVNEPALSTAMADRKLQALQQAGVSTVISTELGCLLHLEGRADRLGIGLRFRHVAEVLYARWAKADGAGPTRQEGG